MLDAGEVAAVGNRRRLALDARLHITIDRLHEVLAVEARVEAEDGTSEQPLEELLTPRADTERLGVRPRNVPEGDDGGFGQPFSDQARQ